MFLEDVVTDVFPADLEEEVPDEDVIVVSDEKVQPQQTYAATVALGTYNGVLGFFRRIYINLFS